MSASETMYPKYGRIFPERKNSTYESLYRKFAFL